MSTPAGFSSGPAFGDASLEVVAGVGVVADPGADDGVEGSMELPVARPAEPVPCRWRVCSSQGEPFRLGSSDEYSRLGLDGPPAGDQVDLGVAQRFAGVDAEVDAAEQGGQGVPSNDHFQTPEPPIFRARATAV